MLVQISNVRLAFPNLFTPGDAKPGQTPYYSCVIPVDPKSANHRALEEAIETVSKEAFGAKAEQVLAKVRKAGDCFYKHEPKVSKHGDVYDGFEGMYSFRASNAQRPLIVNRVNHPVTQESGLIYPGCVVNLQIDVWFQDNQHATRVNGKLLAVQFVKDAEPFGGGVRLKADTAFAALPEEEEEDIG